MSAMSPTPHARPSRAHEALGEPFFDLVEPARFPEHMLRYRNVQASRQVGLDALSDEAWIRHFGRFEPLPGSFPEPLALRYHGHQFRNYNPDLGDGRGFLFAQVHDLGDGRLLDLGTKGSGRTPWSRGGDGRLTLKGGVREVLATTMLAALGVETSQSFSLIETGEALERGDEPSPTRSAVLVRLSHSHIRIGTFQRLAYHGDVDAIRRLLDHVVRHYLPEARREDEAAQAAAFLDAVTVRVARVGAQWMLAGFVHGVLNTDNINVTGESFDYGPWRFLPSYQPDFTAAYFDTGKLYAFGRQPDTLLWNLVRLAECLLPLAPQEALEPVLHGFGERFGAELVAGMLRRLGRASGGVDADAALGGQAWLALRETQVPFERFFFDWYATVPDGYPQPEFGALRGMLSAHAVAPGASREHAYFRRGVPCTMLIDEVEALWARVAADDDWSAFHAKLDDVAVMAAALS